VKKGDTRWMYCWMYIKKCID